MVIARGGKRDVEHVCLAGSVRGRQAIDGEFVTAEETPPWQEQPESPDDPTPAGFDQDMGGRARRSPQPTRASWPKFTVLGFENYAKSEQPISLLTLTRYEPK